MAAVASSLRAACIALGLGTGAVVILACGDGTGPGRLRGVYVLTALDGRGAPFVETDPSPALAARGDRHVVQVLADTFAFLLVEFEVARDRSTQLIGRRRIEHANVARLRLQRSNNAPTVFREATMIRSRAIPVQTEGHLPEDIRRAKAQAIEWFKVLRSAGFKPEAAAAASELKRLTDGFFEFYEGKELDDGHAGVRGMNEELHGRHRAYFLKCRVGKAHVGDKRPAGKRRLVLKIDSAQIKRIYFSDGHYTDTESWTQLIWP